MRFLKYFLIMLAFLAALKSSFAYVDPGTGAMILGSIGPIIGLVLSAIGGFFLNRYLNLKKLFKEHTFTAVTILVFIVALLVFLLFLIIK